jgi:hypothetical protein
MKTVTFDEYREFVKARRDLGDRITEGREICVCQWLDDNNVVQAQAIYQKFMSAGPTSKTYQIREVDQRGIT